MTLYKFFYLLLTYLLKTTVLLLFEILLRYYSFSINHFRFGLVFFILNHFSFYFVVPRNFECAEDDTLREEMPVRIIETEQNVHTFSFRSSYSFSFVYSSIAFNFISFSFFRKSIVIVFVLVKEMQSFSFS